MERKGVIWCFTPNPVLERKYEGGLGRATISAGGKGHNVAKQLAMWGWAARSVICGSTSVPTPVPGSDPTSVPGEWVRWARGDGVGVRMIPGVGGRVRRGWAWVGTGEGEGEGMGRVDFFTGDPEISFQGWAKIRKFWLRNCKEGDWLVVAGSSATGWPKNWWWHLFTDLRRKGVRLFVDSRGKVLEETLRAEADWIKCNLNEAEETFAVRGVRPCFHAMRSIAAPHSSLVITDGVKGLWMERTGRKMHFPALKIRAKDATGSGDVVTALCLLGATAGWPMQKIGRWAVRMGAENAKRNDVAQVPRRRLRC